MARVLQGCLLVVLLAGAALAQEAPQAAAGTEAVTTATLTAVDVPTQMLTVARHNGAEQFRITPKTIIMIACERGALGALKLDDKVRVYYLKEGAAPYAARRVLDAATVAILDAEREGVGAVIEAIETRGEGADRRQVLVVKTAQQQRRELVVRSEADHLPLLLKDGQVASLDAFKPGDAVTVAIKRTSGSTLYLKSLGDPASFTAFAAMRTMRGKVTALAEDRGSLSLDAGGEAGPVTVNLTSATAYYRGGQAAKNVPFEVGEEVVVKFLERSHGAVQARAIFAPESWKAYAEAQAAQTK